jgi:PKD repeat protein
VATNNGLYRSIDAGTTFNIILSENIRDLALKYGDSQTIYAVSSNRFYRSTNGGTSFNQITSGLPTSDVSRIVIGITPAEPDYIYLLLADSQSGFKGLYVSLVSGNFFSLLNNTADIFESNQAWYDLAITVDPNDAEIIYTGVLNLWKSTDAGANFTKISSWSAPTSASYTHADIHYLGFYGNALYCGSDGGIYKSTNGANTFEDLSPGLQIGQFYKIDGTEQNENAIVGGLQDNGGYYTQTGSEGWKNYFGADGMDCAINPGNEDIVYGSIQFGSIYRSNDGGNSKTGIGSPENGAWVTPLQIDANDHSRLLVGYSQLYEYNNGSWNPLTSFSFGGDLNNIKIAPSNSDVIYLSRGTNLYKTTNGGGVVTQITGLPTENITDIEVHNTNPDIVWVTVGGWTNGSKVFSSIDGGDSWSNISGSLPNLPTNCIAYQNNSNGALYIGNDFGVYYYDEIIGDWTDYSIDLPHTIINDIVINHSASVITVGSYGRGVWRSSLNTSTLLAINPFLKSIDNIDEIICDSVIRPVVTVRNIGTEVLTSFILEYGIGNYDLSYSWTGNLESLDEINIDIDSILVSDGTWDFQVRVINPNGGSDDDISNNQDQLSFTVVSNGISMTVHLETDCWGEETTWEIKDVNNNVIISEGPFSSLLELDNLICLSDGCYQFIVNDSYGDGMFGSQYATCGVDGNYSISDAQGNLLVEMGDPDFGFQIIHNFCIGDAAEDLIVVISSSSTQICEGNTIDFQDLSFGQPVSWEWNFEGSSIGLSSVQNPEDILYESAGNFDVSLTITNSNGDASTQVFNDYILILENPESTVLATTDVTCFGLVDGSVILEATGGSPPYQYTVNGDISSNGEFYNLNPGFTSYTVADQQSCSTSGSFEISTPELINVEALVTDENEGNDGSIELEVDGGIPPFNYDWSNGSTDQNIYNLTQGTYTVIITDANGCSFTESYTILVVGISEVLLEEINVYPNPASNELFIDLNQSYQNIKIELITENGKIVRSQMVSNQQLVNFDVAELSEGTYFVKLDKEGHIKTIKVLLVK